MKRMTEKSKKTLLNLFLDVMSPLYSMHELLVNGLVEFLGIWFQFMVLAPADAMKRALKKLHLPLKSTHSMLIQ